MKKQSNKCHKSHMSFSTRQPAHQAPAWRAQATAVHAARVPPAEAADDGGSDATGSARRPPARPACKVDGSACGESAARRPGRGTPRAPASHAGEAIRTSRPDRPGRGAGDSRERSSAPGTRRAAPRATDRAMAPESGRGTGRAAPCRRGGLPPTGKGTRGIFSGRRDRDSLIHWDCTALRWDCATITGREPQLRPGPAIGYTESPCMCIE